MPGAKLAFCCCACALPPREGNSLGSSTSVTRSEISGGGDSSDNSRKAPRPIFFGFLLGAMAEERARVNDSDVSQLKIDIDNFLAISTSKIARNLSILIWN